MSLHTEFLAKCGSLPINMSIIFAACTLKDGRHRSLHSHYQIRQGLTHRTITKFEGSPTPDGTPGPETQISYHAVTRKLLELDHLLNEGQQDDTSLRESLRDNEAIQTVFRACGLTEEPHGLEGGDTMDLIGEFILSFFCYLHGGPQILEGLCRHSILKHNRRWTDCTADSSDSIDANAEAVSGH